MQEERDILIKKIFPQLRKLCEERAVTWTEVDLRWGIDTKAETEQEAEEKVLPLCLQEISRCRPFFIGILGERYGCIQKLDSLPSALFNSYPWLKDYSQSSITELEIIHGLFNNESLKKNAWFYFRSPGYLDAKPDEELAYFIENVERNKQKLQSLKDKIRSAHKNNLCCLRENYVDPEQLGEWVLEDFTKFIDQLFPTGKTLSPLEQETARHESYARNRRLGFVGREDLFTQLNNFIISDSAPVIVTGESGSGKSALIAEWVARWHHLSPNDLIIQHYVGCTYDSANWMRIVSRILGEFKSAFSLPEDIPTDSDQLQNSLEKWISNVTSSHRIILVIDGINQLSDDSTIIPLNWLPKSFPPGFSLIVSTVGNNYYNILHQRGWNEMNVPLFKSTDIIEIAQFYFNIYGKKLTAELAHKLESTPAACNALFLRSVIDELRQFGKHEEIMEKASLYLSSSDLGQLFDHILARWDEDFSSEHGFTEIVRRSLCFIACSRYGLSESELLFLLGGKKSNGMYSQIPRRFWTPFLLASENALAQRAGLLNFGHNYLLKAVQKRWLGNNKIINEFKSLLADYFAIFPEYSSRKLDEYPWLLFQLERWESLKNIMENMHEFIFMFHPRKLDVFRYWRQMITHYDPVTVYNKQIGKAVEAGISGDDVGIIFTSISELLSSLGNYEAAKSILELAVQTMESLKPPPEQSLYYALNALAHLNNELGNHTGAEKIYRRLFEYQERVYGFDNITTLITANNLANTLVNMEKFDPAQPLLKRILTAKKKLLGEGNPSTLNTENNLGALYLKQMNYSSAESVFRHVLGLRIENLGNNDPLSAQSFDNLGVALSEQGKYEEAENNIRQALPIFEYAFGQNHIDTLNCQSNLAFVLLHKGLIKEAKDLYNILLKKLFVIVGLNNPKTKITLSNLEHCDKLIEQIYECKNSNLNKDPVRFTKLLLEAQRIQNNIIESPKAFFSELSQKNITDIPIEIVGIFLEDLREIISLTEEMIEIAPLEYKPWYYQAVAYSFLGESFKALKSINRAIELNNEDTSLVFFREQLVNQIRIK